MHEILLHCFTKIRCVRGFVRDVYMYDHSNSQGAAIDGLEDLTCHSCKTPSFECKNCAEYLSIHGAIHISIHEVMLHT